MKTDRGKEMVVPSSDLRHLDYLLYQVNAQGLPVGSGWNVYIWKENGKIGFQYDPSGSTFDDQPDDARLHPRDGVYWLIQRKPPEHNEFGPVTP